MKQCTEERESVVSWLKELNAIVGNGVMSLPLP